MNFEIFIVVVLALMIGWYLSFSASRLDRLHHRVETSWATLDALLQKRAALAHEIVSESSLDPATAYLISNAAAMARDANIVERSAAESVLSQSLNLVQGAAIDHSLELPTDLLVELSDLTTKVKIATNIHLESVNATRNVRSKPLIRLFRLAGKAPLPVRYAFEDELSETQIQVPTKMRFTKSLIFLVSLLVIILSMSQTLEFSKLPLISTSEKNNFNGLPGSNNQILVVKIDDTKAAHPQIGVEDADVVYVEQVEGGLTRLAAIYTSKLPPLIGPIRSARISDIELLAQFGRVGFAYSGAQTKMRPVIAAANLENLSAERNPPSIYGKDPSRLGPVDMILKPELLLKRANANPNIKIDLATVAPFIFGKAQQGETITASATVKWPSARYELRWDITQKKWLIFFNGVPNLAASGEQLYADTAIIQVVSITPSIYGDKFGEITPFSKTIGSGRAVMLRDGVSYQLNWQRNLETDLTTWKSADGKMANFKPGRIWIFLTDKSPDLAP